LDPLIKSQLLQGCPKDRSKTAEFVRLLWS
jgi:hypothetical protein